MIRKYVSFLLLVIFCLTFFYGCKILKKEESTISTDSEEISQKILYWTCGMHPSVKISPEVYEQGSTKCPICAMDLVPVYEGKPREGKVTVNLTELERRLASVKTYEVTYLPLFHEITTIGRIDYDERKVEYISARVKGRVDSLFVSFTGEKVEKGDPIVLLYSPPLVTAQQEYILAFDTFEKIKNSSIEETINSAKSLLESAKNRLLLWGVTEEQIEKLRLHRRKPDTHLTIYSYQTGIVVEKYVSEGRYVNEGKDLYKIADLSNLWVFADVYEYEISWLKLGLVAEITSSAYPGEVFKGKVSFINPYVDEKTRSIRIRIDLPNPFEKFKPGMYGNVTIISTIAKSEKIYYTCPMHPEVIEEKFGNCPDCGMALEKVRGNLSLAIPKFAVLDVGLRKLVYVDKGEGNFEQREIKIGPESEVKLNGKKEKFYPVIQGVAKGEKVVVKANFLIDSQAQLTGAAAGAYGGALETEKE